MVLIANRAYRMMQLEIARYPNVETGGLLLGYFDESQNLLQVLEATDGGMRAFREAGSFIYDEEYVQHVAGILAEFYQPPLQMVGIWHKHNHAYEPIFSKADECMHEEVIKKAGRIAVSVLFQKMEADNYRMGAFWLDETGGCREVDFVIE